MKIEVNDWTFQANVGLLFEPSDTTRFGFTYLSKADLDFDDHPGKMYRYGVGFKYQKSEDLLLGGGLSFLWQGDLVFKAAGGPASEGQVSGQYDNVSITFMSCYVQW